MKLEDFQSILDNNGIKYIESGQSLAVETCPACGSTAYKVRFRVVGDIDESQPFFGRCQRGSCRKGYSSFSYLLKMQVPLDEVRSAHYGDTPDEAWQKVAPEEEFKLVKENKEVKVVAPDTDISKFMHVENWPDHPASVYAIKRGYSRIFKDNIMICPTTNAVVFIVRDPMGKVLGYQRRYVNPLGKTKTRTSDGFSREFCMELRPPIKYLENADILICEGPFTAVAGIHYKYWAITTFGSEINTKQLDTIYALSVKTGKNIAVAVDNDDAGKHFLDTIDRYLSWHHVKPYAVYSPVENDLSDALAAKAELIIDRNIPDVIPSIPGVNFM